MYQNGKNIIFIDRNAGSINSFLNSLNKSKPLSTEEEYELWTRMRQGSQKARERLIHANLRYVVVIAKKYLMSGTAFEDLCMAGCEGIVKAVDKFNASLGFRFISFATWYIEQEIRSTAYDHIRHKADSLDQPFDEDNERSAARVDNLKAHATSTADWHLLYNDNLDALKIRSDKRLYGAGKLMADLHSMLQGGYTISDFANKHHLDEHQMNRFFKILKEEAGILRPVA